MKRIGPALIVAICLSGAAYASDQSACVVKASAQLPPSPNLKVVSANVQKLNGGKGIKSFFLIRFSVIAAGQRAKFNYWCAAFPDGDIRVVNAGQHPVVTDKRSRE